MNAKLILTNNVNDFKKVYDKESADGGLHLSLGKVLMAVELGLITRKEMDVFIEMLFEEHHQLKSM